MNYWATTKHWTIGCTLGALAGLLITAAYLAGWLSWHWMLTTAPLVLIGGLIGFAIWLKK